MKNKSTPGMQTKHQIAMDYNLSPSHPITISIDISFPSTPKQTPSPTKQTTNLKAKTSTAISEITKRKKSMKSSKKNRPISSRKTKNNSLNNYPSKSICRNNTIILITAHLKNKKYKESNQSTQIQQKW